MGLTRIGKETWDLVGSEGGETRLPPDTRADVDFPTHWRVFGPAGADKTSNQWSATQDYMYHREITQSASAEVEGFSEIPESLTIGDETFDGRDVELAGDTLDFSALFGGHEAGQQAYAMAEMDVERETEVVFGAGCQWWMQWWVDGEAVLDTLATGNQSGYPNKPTLAMCRVGPTDHCFRRRLTAGKHLLVVRTIGGQVGWVLRAGIASPRDEMLNALPRSNRWHFLPELNDIRPPDPGYWTPTMAIRTDLCLSDVTMECEYQRPESRGNFGFVFGAQDSGHYYWAQTPASAQLWRARAFYAAISMADGSGHIRSLKMQLMPNVPANCGPFWHTMKVERRGNCIQMWVDGVKGPSATDDTYGAGRVGIAGFSGNLNYFVRNLKINGRSVEAPPWPEGDRRGQAWYEPVADLEPVEGQHPWQMVKLSDGEIIMPVGIRMGGATARAIESYAISFCSSQDGGRTWSQYAFQEHADTMLNGQWLALESGVIRRLTFENDRRQFTLRDSSDRGVTWSEEKASKLLGKWDRDMFREKTRNDLTGFTRLADGTLVAVIGHSHEGLMQMVPNSGQSSWPLSGMGQPCCTRSEDLGLTWSEPVPMDYASLYYGDGPETHCGDFTESPVATLTSGRIVALSRPFRSPFMWQTHSDDGGRSWRTACYAPFSGAGGPQLIATRSGYLAVVKRWPGLALNISVDDGVNWDEGTMIDYSTSFNGRALESEPDVVLVAYGPGMGATRGFLMRMQRIRITPQGPVPLGTD